MADRIAIDVALLPPDDFMDKAIAINRQYGPRFLLNKSNRLPHLTLSQAIIKKVALDEAISRLRQVASEFAPIKLQAKIVEDRAIFFRVPKNKILGRLHKKIMDSFEDLVTYDAETEYYYDTFVRQKSLNWVRNFKLDAAYDNYDPHISLGIKLKPKENLESHFTVNRLAICHLGNHNTCRQILAETTLK